MRFEPNKTMKNGYNEPPTEPRPPVPPPSGKNFRKCEGKFLIGIDLANGNDVTVHLCPYCFGTGKLKAMQSAMTYGGSSVRAEDTTVKCDHCKGSGLKGEMEK